METLEVSPRDFRAALGRFASGVTVVTVPEAGERAGVRGVTANAFLSVSLRPPLVLVSIDKKARAHAALQSAERYGVSILAQDQGPISDHFAGFAETVTPTFTELSGLAVVEGAVAHLVCRIVDRHEAGDHTLFIGEVEALATNDGQGEVKDGAKDGVKDDANGAGGDAPLLYFKGGYGRFV